MSILRRKWRLRSRRMGTGTAGRKRDVGRRFGANLATALCRRAARENAPTQRGGYSIIDRSRNRRKTKSLSEALLTEALIFSRSLRGALLARGLLWYSTKLENILGDFGNRPGFRSSLHDHSGFHDLAADGPQ